MAMNFKKIVPLAARRDTLVLDGLTTDPHGTRVPKARDQAKATVLTVDPDYIVKRIRRARAATGAGRKALAEVLAIDPHNAEAEKIEKLLK